MKKVKISLVSIDDVKDFVKKTNELSCEVDLTLGKYVIDAKSIMGIFSLDLLNPIKLVAHSDSCDQLFEEIKDYIVDTEA